MASVLSRALAQEWFARGIGEIIYVNTSIVGASIPPSIHPELVFIELTAGKTGSGAYNEGKLTSESVTGSAPLVVATAVVNVAGSPINGKTVHLINTEGAILRPLTSGVGSLQQDQMQKVTGSFQLGDNNRISIVSPTGAFYASGSSATAGNQISGGSGANIFSFDNSLTARAGDETRMKNVGVTAYMRVR